MTETPATRVGSWGDLLGPKYLGTSTVLAGGVGLYATNEFLTISLLPSAVADISYPPVTYAHGVVPKGK